MVYWTALQLGMRQGEILALRWRDVNLTDGLLHVRFTLGGMANGRPILAEPKTDSSKRMVPIPESLRAMLRTHLVRQSEARLRNGKSWIDNDLVFCGEIGEPISGNRVRKSFRQFAKTAGIPDEAHFHDLRHACATVLAEQGVPPRVAMEILGHRDMRTAELIYKHAREAAMHDAMRSAESVFNQLRETA